MILKEQDDFELIEKILNGCQKSQTILYDRYKKYVENYIRKKYPLNVDSDDDVSEILIKVFINLSDFNTQKSKFSTCVCSIVNNYMIDKWRANSNTITYSIDTLNQNYVSTTGTICVCLSDAVSFSNIIDFDSSMTFISNHLSPQDYTMLNMKYIQGYDYNEIGSEFNVSSNTASNRVNYIKSKLKKHCNELIYEGD